MLKTRLKTLSGSALREAGWNALVNSLGLINATRFIMQYETGFGDYTKIKKEIFKGKSLAVICKEIEKLEAKI